MKLETSISLRKDGAVRVRGLDKQDYEFKLDEATGMVVCDVEHPETLAHLLRLGGFFPASEADHEKAASLIDLVQKEDSQSEEPDEDEDEDEDDIDPNALPLEAGTPPAPRKKKAKAE